VDVGVGHPGKAKRAIPVVFVLLVLLQIASSPMYYAERGVHPTNSPACLRRCGGASLR
jgi:hypothetical protein